MSDLVLHDGTEVTFDFYKINLMEWRGLFSKDEEEQASDEKIARVCGLTYEKFASLPYPDYHKLMQEFWKKAKDPLQDSKNSPSVPS